MRARRCRDIIVLPKNSETNVTEVDRLIESNYFGLHPDMPIYRILRVEHLEKDAGNGTLTLCRVIGWEDPHEGAFFRRSVHSKETNEIVGLGDLSKDWFGQCWSLHDESDSMWRIYNPDGLSVRLQSTPRMLMSALFRSRVAVHPVFSDNAWIALYMGEVAYHNGAAFSQLMREKVSGWLDSSGKGMAQQMCHKREAFRHEGEVRLLYHAHLNGEHPNGDKELLSKETKPHVVARRRTEVLPRFIHLPFDWACIQSVMIGPLVEGSKAAAVRAAVQRALPNVPILVSDLYGEPNYYGEL